MIRSQRKLPGKVRIIGGRWKRSKLVVLDRPGLRPTPDRVRETLFNWLGQDLGGWRCLDAFAGSGALGFEAASRGAAEVLMLESDTQLQGQLLATMQRLKTDTVRIENADALAWMARSEASRFELVFLDPPYDTALHERALAAAARLLVPGGFVYLEAPLAPAPETLALHALKLHRQGRTGMGHFGLLQQCAGI